MEAMELILSLSVGLGLSAACGFRIFVPLLVISIANKAGHLELADSFEWMGSTAAIITFATATVLEVSAYYVPWVDNLLDTEYAAVEYNFPSDWDPNDGVRPRTPTRHMAAGAPFSWMVLAGVRL